MTGRFLSSVTGISHMICTFVNDLKSYLKVKNKNNNTETPSYAK